MLAFVSVVGYDLAISVKRRLSNQIAKGHLLMKKLQNQQSGFTIIEVLIVLAIAGLIMLIVFLAVPALQRNSRNTQIKNDVATVVGGMNEFASNNNGALPADICSDTAGTVRAVATGTCNTASSPEIAKVRGGVSVADGTAMPTATNTIVVNLNIKCNGTAFATTATNRAFAAGFLVETSGGTSTQCQES